MEGLVGDIAEVLGVTGALLGVPQADNGCLDEGAGVGTLDDGLESVGLMALLGVLLDALLVATEVLLTDGRTLIPPTGVFIPGADTGFLSMEKGKV